MTTYMTDVTCQVTYQQAAAPQTGGPCGLSGHVTLQQEVGFELRQQQQGVGEQADERQRDEREADTMQTPGHTHLCV